MFRRWGLYGTDHFSTLTALLHPLQTTTAAPFLVSINKMAIDFSMELCLTHVTACFAKDESKCLRNLGGEVESQ